ncbi:Gfo/Idh/MocA family oxidoreductase [Paenibacillus lycopersici]|uniref:Gfo/Idh/MocA family oxidoreductase n=1 Tax=Paenibacillus lycopersici TaxID=2704462 RepID=A0A6C0G042_9BACL|nr:Gfo/Idh/MocA family oxidoreductase [Paenibacillus lycopersici]QHT61183.1 Gfo/Idh/MocA family oxidoreductase [Paenibacillus lycopersici]
MTRYNIAVIGTGDMGGNHVRGWIAAGHHVVSVTDVDLPRAQELAERYNVPNVYADHREALEDDSVDIVSVCLPLRFHAPITIDAAARGKHVFCEKPLASSFEDARRMEEAVERAGVRFGIGFQRNFAEGVSAAKRWAEEGRFGHPLVFSSDLLQEVRPKIAMHDKNGNKGPFVDACCHYFYMWNTVFQSKPKRLFASGGILAKDRPEIAHFDELAIDTGVVTVEYDSGDIGTMTVSWGLAKHTRLRGRPDRIIGPLGGAEGSFNQFGGDILIDLFVGDGQERIVLKQEDLFRTELKLFADAIAEGRPAPVGFDQGKEMLAMSFAVLESIETGRIIELA